MILILEVQEGMRDGECLPSEIRAIAMGRICEVMNRLRAEFKVPAIVLEARPGTEFHFMDAGNAISVHTVNTSEESQCRSSD